MYAQRALKAQNYVTTSLVPFFVHDIRQGFRRSQMERGPKILIKNMRLQ